ncbi:MAG: hypothetical protein P9M02_01675 [Candidatus Susulua stagnicola]|nr:hypothetical protein [Candidatus Susulua stagnicola]
MAIKQLTKHTKSPAQPINFNWPDNPAVKNLLDVISSILAEEYVEIAKKNHDVFSNEK